MNFRWKYAMNSLSPKGDIYEFRMPDSCGSSSPTWNESLSGEVGASVQSWRVQLPSRDFPASVLSTSAVTRRPIFNKYVPL